MSDSDTSTSSTTTMPAQPPTLLTLPIEILTQTLSNLPSTSLLACTLTSKLLHRLISQSAELQYIFAKDKAGVEDSFPISGTSAHMLMSTSDKLAILEERERAWLAFDYKFADHVSFSQTTSGLYDVTPNAYFLGCAVDGNQRITDALQYARLPTRKGQDVIWDKINVGRYIIDFGTSVEEHDLIALVCYRPSDKDKGEPTGMDIHLRRFSNGLEHPHAQKHVIPVCNLLPELGQTSISIEISGENLVLCVDYIQAIGLGAVMFIYNWYTGVLKCKPTTISNNGLVFLRHDIFIQPDTNQLTLDAYYIPPSDSPLSGPNQPMYPFMSLRLPGLKRGAEPMSMSCRGDPSPRDPASVPPPGGRKEVKGRKERRKERDHS
ncbi:hypothetical protein BDQ17DRAFT_1428572 [Cyathus striatus]|nr:hypothetical protein BDQ17DRAFT_1428572 [Cyathus striatus]